MKAAFALLLCAITAIALAQGFQKPKTQKGSAQSLCTSSPVASALAMAFDPTAQPIFTTLQASVGSNGVQSFVRVPVG